VNKIHQAVPQTKTGKRTFGNVKTLATGDGGVTKKKDEKPFDAMNNIAANLLLNMTR
jgi:tubulin epsilon